MLGMWKFWMESKSSSLLTFWRGGKWKLPPSMFQMHLLVDLLFPKTNTKIRDGTCRVEWKWSDSKHRWISSISGKKSLPFPPFIYQTNPLVAWKPPRFFHRFFFNTQGTLVQRTIRSMASTCWWNPMPPAGFPERWVIGIPSRCFQKWGEKNPNHEF